MEESKWFPVCAFPCQPVWKKQITARMFTFVQIYLQDRKELLIFAT
jgi:hypothetical protein